MIKQQLTCVLIFIASLMAAPQIFAQTINLSVQAFQTLPGQSFNFSFLDIPAAEPLSAMFKVTARGNFSVGNSNEFINILMDDNTNLPGLHAELDNVIDIFGSDDVMFELTFTLEPEAIIAMTHDGKLAIDLNLSPAVTLVPGAFVRIDLAYDFVTTAVSTVNSLCLLLPGLWLIRRRRNARAA